MRDSLSRFDAIMPRFTRPSSLAPYVYACKIQVHPGLTLTLNLTLTLTLITLTLTLTVTLTLTLTLILNLNLTLTLTLTQADPNARVPSFFETAQQLLAVPGSPEP